LKSLTPYRPNARDMQPERLKKEFGPDVTSWGVSADPRSILNLGTPAQVKEHVRTNVEVLATGAGFVFSTIHNILPDVPPQNIIALFEALDEFR